MRRRAWESIAPPWPQTDLFPYPSHPLPSRLPSHQLASFLLPYTHPPFAYPFVWTYQPQRPASLSIDAQMTRKVQCEVGESEGAQRWGAHRRGCEVRRERGAPLEWSGSHTLAARAERRQTRCGVQRGQCGEPCWFGQYSSWGGIIRWLW